MAWVPSKGLVASFALATRVPPSPPAGLVGRGAYPTFPRSQLHSGLVAHSTIGVYLGKLHSQWLAAMPSFSVSWHHQLQSHSHRLFAGTTPPVRLAHCELAP